MRAPKRQLIWSNEAEEDLLAIWRFGAGEWSLNAADEHERTLWHATNRLIENPDLGKSRSELVTGLRSILVDPHVVFYRVTSKAIEIVRVLHQREDIETLFD